MLRKLCIVFFVMILSTSFGLAHEDKEVLDAELEVEAGTTPDSPLYGLELAIEKINIALQRNSQERAKIALKYAQERLEEAHLMMEENKAEAFEKAKEEHRIYLETSLEKWSDIDDNTDEFVEQDIRFERMLDAHNFHVIDDYAASEDEFKEDFDDMRNSVSKARVRALELREKYREKLRQRGLDAISINDLYAGEINRTNASDFKKGVAERTIKLAETCLLKAKTQNVSEERQDQFAHMISVSEFHFDASKSAFDSGKYGRAYGQATAAWHICEAALRYANGRNIDDVREAFDVAETESSREVAIDLECDRNITKVEVEIEDNGLEEETEFELDGCQDINRVKDEIIERTSLTKEEVDLYIGEDFKVYDRFRFRFEEETDRQEELMRKFMDSFGDDFFEIHQSGRFRDRMRIMFGDDEEESEIGDDEEENNSGRGNESMEDDDNNDDDNSGNGGGGY